MSAYLNRSLVGHLRDGIEVVAEAIFRRCERSRADPPISVLLLPNGNVYAIDSTSATCARVVHAESKSLIATYKLGMRNKHRTTVTVEDIAADLRAGALGIGWVT
jgi:hypothetical protein